MPLYTVARGGATRRRVKVALALGTDANGALVRKGVPLAVNKEPFSTITEKIPGEASQIEAGPGPRGVGRVRRQRSRGFLI